MASSFSIHKPRLHGLRIHSLLLCGPLLLAAAGVLAQETSASDSSADLESAASATSAVTAPPAAEGSQVDAAGSGGAQQAQSGAKTLSGMSLLGNQEAPKALVIVPWKSSRIGDARGLSRGLDDSRGPVDKDVFMRELAYYEIRSN